MPTQRFRAVVTAVFASTFSSGCDGCGGDTDPGNDAAIGSAEVVRYLDFDDPTLPTNNAGDTYPNPYSGTGGGDGTSSIVDEDCVVGSCLEYVLSERQFYLQLNAHNANDTRGFAREYVEAPEAWTPNTVNRLTFWIKMPAAAEPLATGGRANIQVGTYVKQVEDADVHSDEAGGGHWYHHLNVPAEDTWTRVVLNMHPNHERGTNGGLEQQNQPHPTGEAGYNYFDALTRWYIAQESASYPAAHPQRYYIDEIHFAVEPHAENDEQVYSITATFFPATGRLSLGWMRNKDENALAHEVRYAFSSIHEIGWDAATPAPNGMIEPEGDQGYNGMVYETTAIDVASQSRIFFAIRPVGASTFSQMELPLLR